MIKSDGQKVPVAKDDDEPVVPGRVTGKQLRVLMADDAPLDDLIDSAQQGGVQLNGQGGVQLNGQGGMLPEIIKAVLEGGLAAKLAGDLGYEHGDPAGRGSPNSRNGSTSKTLSTEIGPVPLDVPRDRGVDVRAAAGAEGSTPPRRPGRADHLALRRRDDGPRQPDAPGPDSGNGAVPRHDQQDHRRGPGGGGPRSW